ncbi:hypothetical protein [Borreliella garinii]|uniref:hypothetical protein n=1 Tax=Borreliella garinii TaxID=29519 RepID=UPI0013A597FA|nr:hypothetical protein [Borreliella garinii]
MSVVRPSPINSNPKDKTLNDIKMCARGLETHIHEYYYFLVLLLFDYTLEKSICLILNTGV